jgi:hypothetical protein
MLAFNSGREDIAMAIKARAEMKLEKQLLRETTKQTSHEASDAIVHV